LKSKNIIVIGGGGHAKVVISILKKMQQYHICGYTDFEDIGSILDVPYLGSDHELARLIEENEIQYSVTGVGQITCSPKRQNIAEMIARLGLKAPALISPNAVVNEDVEIGEGTVVMDGVVLNPGTKIGKFCIVNTGTIVEHDCVVGDFTHLAPGVTISGGTKIGDNSQVSVGATIIQGIKISADCMIGAGAVVVKNCEQPGVYFGVPAKYQGDGLR